MLFPALLEIARVKKQLIRLRRYFPENISVFYTLVKFIEQELFWVGEDLRGMLQEHGYLKDI